MKKIFTVLICVLLAMSLAGCSQANGGGSNDSGDPSNKQPKETLAVPEIYMLGSLTDVNGIEVHAKDETGEAEKFEIYVSDKADGDFTLLTTIGPDEFYEYSFSEEDVSNDVHSFFYAVGIKGSERSPESEIGEFGIMK